MVFLHNPLPSSLRSECRKAATILNSFVDPRQAFGPDKIIPPSVLANAKGLAVLTIAKFGFIGTLRGGSGLVVARRPDGSWSAPSAIGTAGAGVGAQLGAEVTDFVMILNDAAAVKTFAQSGSLTLGGNVSVAAGPVGRNAEASGAASLKSVSAIFSYSKTKGLFAGVSLEGSAIIERKEANAKFYGGPISAAQLLSGSVQPPMEADALYTVLNSPAFSPRNLNMYNSVDDSVYNDYVGGTEDRSPAPGGYNRPNRASTWASSGDNTTGSVIGNRRFESTYLDEPDYSINNNNNKKTPPGRPTAPKPVFKMRSSTLGADQAVALYTFKPTQEGDLGFQKGDVITITKRTESNNDWWTGRIGDKTGIFPSNYVETVR